jgi:hypothetical protein
MTYNPASVRPYYYFICGAAGGVTGWFLTALLGRHAIGAPTLGMLVVQGAILGSLIGLGGGIFDGLAARSLGRVARFGGSSMMLGLAAGCIALPLAEKVYSVMLGDSGKTDSGIAFASGVVCWILFGALIGLGEGFSKGSQSWKGMLGGAAGGAAGGGFYELARMGNTDATPGTLALAFLILGGSIGAAVALVSSILKGASLLIENGKLKGYDLDISKYVHKYLGSLKPGIIGSQWDASLYLPGDPGIAARHASISYADGMPTLTVLPEARQQQGVTRVNGRNVSSTWPLHNGDRIEIGSTFLVFRHKNAEDR